MGIERVGSLFRLPAVVGGGYFFFLLLLHPTVQGNLSHVAATIPGNLFIYLFILLNNCFPNGYWGLSEFRRAVSCYSNRPPAVELALRYQSKLLEQPNTQSLDKSRDGMHS
jgi:hypothetical protein